jgi:hypothetical protein
MDIIDEILDKIMSDIQDSINDINIEYNSKTFNLKDPDECIPVKRCSNTYTSSFQKSKYIIYFTYKNLQIKTYNVHILYVILQHIYGVSTIIELSELSWDYSQWSVKITASKSTTPLSNHMKILQYILNRPSYGVPMKVPDLDNEYPLSGRGWGGERPREVNYKLGFPLMTYKRLPERVKPGELVILCPFPTESINPKRIAIITPGDEHKCFTCGVQEGDLDKFGNPVKFERGHLEPHILGGSNLSRPQCKWCNTFYKDKITWNSETNKPQFNVKAVIRDAQRPVVIKAIEELGYIRDLKNELENVKRERDALKRQIIELSPQPHSDVTLGF